jgi:hypothetical protein
MVTDPMFVTVFVSCELIKGEGQKILEKGIMRPELT